MSWPASNAHPSDPISEATFVGQILVEVWGLKPSLPNSLVTAFRASANDLRQPVPRETRLCVHLFFYVRQGQDSAALSAGPAVTLASISTVVASTATLHIRGHAPWHEGEQEQLDQPRSCPESPCHTGSCGLRCSKKTQKKIRYNTGESEG